MKLSTTIFLILFAQRFIVPVLAQTISYDPASPRQSYAVARMQEALTAADQKTAKSNKPFHINLRIDSLQLQAEAYVIQLKGRQILVRGGDERGLIYGCLSIAEDLIHGHTLAQIKNSQSKPFLPFRGIKYDLPWDTYRHSYALSLHDETCRDTLYWKAFLDMMAENRLNSLTLWNLHTYTYLIKPKNFPEASPWTDKEMKEWQTLFHAITHMASERAIDTYIMPFNIFVTPEFARAHQVAMDNLEHHFFVKGDTADIIERYTRECVTQMLNEYPELTGMGLTLGEGMGGMTPTQRESWVRETIIEGLKQANRPSKLIHRIPLSSNTGSGGATSIETEQLTRKIIESEADLGFTEGPIWADLKFNWSHAHSSTKLFKVHGGKLYDTYFKPTPEKYKITWTARNEDFFCLRWGVPAFVRQHILDNKQAYSGGYFIGSETYIPAKDYFTSDTTSMTWSYAFERQWLFYKIWGRLLYDPYVTDNVFNDEFIYRYGNRGKHLLAASVLAGKTPLRLASDFDLRWDFTLYSEGMMALDDLTKRVEYISIDRLIHQPPLDTDYVSVDQYVRTVSSQNKLPQTKITPPILASMLTKDCNKALRLVKNIDSCSDKALFYEVADIRTWAYLGLHLAEKIKGAIALQTYRTQGKDINKQTAIDHLTRALQYWDEVIKITRPIYKDMPLVHYSEQDGLPWQENDHLRFHWEHLRGTVAKDVEIARRAERE